MGKRWAAWAATIGTLIALLSVPGVATADRITITASNGGICDLDSTLWANTGPMSPIFFNIHFGTIANCNFLANEIVLSESAYLTEISSAGSRQVDSTSQSAIFPGVGNYKTYALGEKSNIYTQAADQTANIPGGKGIQWVGSSRPTCTSFNSGHSIWCWGLSDRYP
jgi:hypothetical protein